MEALRRVRSAAKELLEGHRSRVGKGLDFLIQALIVVSIVSFSIETLPTLSAATRAWLRAAEVAIVAIFTVEYLTRLWVADRALRFAVSFSGLVDLAAIAPFYLATGLDLRSLRALRLLRLLKLLRYNRSIRLFADAFRLIREELILFGAAALVVLYLAAVGIYFFECEAQPEKFGSVFHSLWWAVATLTTVGYGDAYPVTVGGRIFTFAVLVVGVGVVAVPSGLLASALTRIRTEQQERAPEKTP